ncbi:MAG: hypothetical protein NZ902_01330 [Acidilobaceae archaeon]|nr:hypothetical protein [Acidilobaceae archaeon]MDW7973893.1 hypothetical protein [Sulfolobales archaeon]
MKAVLALLLISLAQLTLILNWQREDAELGRLEAVVVSDGVYAVGKRGSYLTVGKYGPGGSRIWFNSVDLKGNVSVLSAWAGEKGISVVVNVRKGMNNSLVKLTVGERGEIVVERRTSLFPRFYPYDVVEIGGAMYIAGASYSFLTDLDYLIARVDGATSWSLEERGGSGDQGYRCLLRAPEDRLLAVGVGERSVVVTLVSQLGDVVGNYSLDFEGVQPEVLDCVEASRGIYAVVGRLDGVPMVMKLLFSSTDLLQVSYSLLPDLPGVATSVTSIPGGVAVSLASPKGPVLALYDMQGPDPRLIRSYNLTEVAKGLGPTSSAAAATGIVIGGERGGRALILAMELEAPQGGLSLIQLLPTFLLILAIAALAVAIYKRRLKKPVPERA